MTDLQYIETRLSLDEMMTQLAEEAAELAQAALKLRRAENKTNPTPVTALDAYANLFEEVADVMVCLHVAGVQLDPALWQPRMDKKLARWAQRLHDAEEAV